MKKTLSISFGEKIDDYDVPVFNEREVRAAAGILFFIGVIGASTVFLTGGLQLTRIFIVGFFIDFVIRLLINPAYAPSLIFGRIIVGNQTPEYVSAAPKRLAWGLGLMLASYMLLSLVLFGIMNPFNLVVCVICLTLLFFETAFGICVGCLLYNVFTKNRSSLCSGDVCTDKKKEAIQHVSAFHIAIVAGFIIFLGFINTFIQVDFGQAVFSSEEQGVVADDCTPPQWAIDMGHEDIYKLHHGCEN